MGELMSQKTIFLALKVSKKAKGCAKLSLKILSKYKGCGWVRRVFVGWVYRISLQNQLYIDDNLN